MQAVSWQTDGTVANAEGQVALADHGPQFETRAKAVPAATGAQDNNLPKLAY